MRGVPVDFLSQHRAGLRAERWMTGIYRKSPQYKDLSNRMKRNFEYGLGIASNYALKPDRYGRHKFGQLSLNEITPGLDDKLYAKVRVDLEPVLDINGKAI